MRFRSTNAAGACVTATLLALFGANPAYAQARETPPPARPSNKVFTKQVQLPDPAAARSAAESAPAAAGTPPSLSSPGAPAQPGVTAAAKRSREIIVAAVDVAEADAQRTWLASQGASILRRRNLPRLGWLVAVYRLPPDRDVAALLAEFAKQWPNSMPERNEHYAALADNRGAPAEFAADLIGWPRGCTGARRVAILDGPVNIELPDFRGRWLRFTQIVPAAEQADFTHGTSIAALLLGSRQSAGLLPDAEVSAGGIMQGGRGEEFTTTEWLLRGLDWYLSLSPRPAVLNLSLGGPYSLQLERALAKVLPVARVVAAVGNDGSDTPVYPAAFAGVIAVTAIDAQLRPWRDANRGAHIALAAPGVEVWTIGGDGRGYYASGTSFATAYVSAALALAPPEASALPRWLEAHSRDLGPAGRDPQFGYGALTMQAACR